ncbi:MAG: hypothetical protein M1835_005447 [Candelina submexicana]|nr:MAG: hypothetical protein M1835_005447 [Candelina submexicana]
MAPSNRPSTPLIFPFYLLPPLPFRRRTSSTSSTESTTCPDAAPTPTAAPNHHLSGHTSYLRCARCSTSLCLTSQIISKGFTGRHGRAYLVSASSVPSISLSATSSSTSSSSSASANSLPNTHTHKAVPRQLVTGAHTVSDVSCVFCGSVLGWKYVAAEEESQRYKVGKFILETRRICSVSDWESGGRLAMPPVDLEGGKGKSGGEEVVFDSGDEDECEDLFAGVWSPALAARRRRGRRFGRGGDAGDRTRSEE